MSAVRRSVPDRLPRVVRTSVGTSRQMCPISPLVSTYRATCSATAEYLLSVGTAASCSGNSSPRSTACSEHLTSCQPSPQRQLWISRLSRRVNGCEFHVLATTFDFLAYPERHV